MISRRIPARSLARIRICTWPRPYLSSLSSSRSSMLWATSGVAAVRVANSEASALHPARAQVFRLRGELPDAVDRVRRDRRFLDRLRRPPARSTAGRGPVSGPTHGRLEGHRCEPVELRGAPEEVDQRRRWPGVPELSPRPAVQVDPLDLVVVRRTARSVSPARPGARQPSATAASIHPRRRPRMAPTSSATAVRARPVGTPPPGRPARARFGCRCRPPGPDQLVACDPPPPLAERVAGPPEGLGLPSRESCHVVPCRAGRARLEGPQIRSLDEAERGDLRGSRAGGRLSANQPDDLTSGVLVEPRERGLQIGAAADRLGELHQRVRAGTRRAASATNSSTTSSTWRGG